MHDSKKPPSSLPSVLVNPSASELRAHGGVMTGTGWPYFMPGYRGGLSIKTMIRGSGVWRTPSGVHRVDPDHVLILNHGQTYTLAIDGDAGPIETFCPFFSERLLRDAVACRRRGAVLPDELDPPVELPAFVERLQRPDPRLMRALGRLRGALRADAPELAVGHIHDLVDVVLDAATAERARIAAISAARAPTRDELFRRVHRAVDWAHANLSTPITLVELAGAAAMAPYHFHRAFREIVGMPPGRYVTELRLDRARRLLRETRHSVTEVCLMVGFESLGTFSTRFKRRFHVAPNAWRAISQA